MGEYTRYIIKTVNYSLFNNGYFVPLNGYIGFMHH